MGNQENEILIKDLTALPYECEWVEFKVSHASPDDIGEYISALSNSACYHKQPFGYLAFGVENESHRMVGTEFNSYQKVNGQELENWLATQLNPRIDFNIIQFEYLEMKFVIFKIQATKSQPVDFRNHGFIRIGSYKKKIKDHPEREREIWNKVNDIPFEFEFAAMGLTEDEVLDKIDYPGFFSLLKIPLPTNKDRIIEKLTQEKVVVRVEGQFCITNVGAILFAADIDKFESLARKALRVIYYDGNDRIRMLREQVGKRGYAIGFEGLMNFIEATLPTQFVIEKALRKQVTAYPILALRELIANALLHQDFNIPGSSPMVEVFHDRIEITNPGKPLIDTRRFLDHSPQSRNEYLGRLMRRCNVCEEAGTGIDKVVYECEFHQLPAPAFISAENYTRVIIYAAQKFNSMDKEDKIRACYLHACLKHVSGSIMTNQSLRERLGIPERNYSTVSRIIADTKEEGHIKPYSLTSTSKKDAKYIPYWA